MTDTVGSGRKAEAARNDGRILDAAREVFLADPGAPVSAVAARAGVGISALYRRYPSKEHMLAELARDGLTRFGVDLDLALADDGDPWEVFVACLLRVLEGQSQALAQRLAGSFTPTPDLTELAIQVGDRFTALHRRTRRAGVLRKDIGAADVVLLLETVSLIQLPDEARTAQLRARVLTLITQALRAPGLGRLPGPATEGAELAERWRPAGP